MTELLLIRHGETDWNRELRFQGQVDVPLNALGHEQARRLGERLAGEPAQHLYCSDLIRTRQTALPLAERLALPRLDERGLREQHFGRIDGLSVDEVKAGHPETWAQWLRFQEDYAVPEGESTRAFHARVMEAVRRLAAAHPQQTLVLVTHGGVLDMVFRTARQLPLSGPRQSQIPNAGLSRVRVQGSGALEILEWADTRHLEGLPAQPVYDQSRLAATAASSPSAA